jgi:hypothetical protein
VVHVDFLPCGVTINAQYITLTCFAMIFTKWFGREDLGKRLGRFSLCMAVLIYMHQIWRRWHWQQWTGKLWGIPPTTWT